MYADRHNRSSGLDPRSLGIAVAITGAMIAGLVASPPVTTILKPPPLRIIDVPIQPPPPEPPPPPKPIEHQQTQSHPINAPKPVVELPRPTDQTQTVDVVLPTPVPSSIGTTIIPDVTPTPTLVTLSAEVDPAHRGDLQPTYPAAELRAEREGVVTVRVLIGVDGRVHQVEAVSATSDAFFRATQDQALRRWRFHPATRGSVPIESWRQMTIRFVIPR